MKRFLAIILLLIPAVTFGAITAQNTLYDRVLASDLAVASTGTVYSSAMTCFNMDYAGAYIKCSGTAPSVKVYVQQSYSATTGFEDVATNSLHATITSTAANIENVPLKFMGWMRFKIVGQAGNSANTKIDILVSRDTKLK